MNTEIAGFFKVTAKSESDTPIDRTKPMPAPELAFPQGANFVKLPEPELLPDLPVNFLEMVEMRSSIRSYSGKKLTLKDLSLLLWCTQGVKMPAPNNASRRTVPSAGARHAFETYLVVNRVEGLEPGVYRYLAFEHLLLPMDFDDAAREKLLAAFPGRKMVENSAVTFIWGAQMERLTAYAGARGYRYAFLDAGHVCQNLYLAAEAIHAGVCAIGSFYDEKINECFSFDGVERFVIYAATVGFPS